MVAFILRRLAQSILVMLVVSLVAFFMFQFLGDPVNQMVGIDTPVAAREALRERLGLTDPMIIRFGKFIVNAAQLDFGLSYQHKIPVTDLLLERWPATIELSFVSAIIAVALALPAGVYTGLYRNRWSSKAMLTLSLVGISVPTFLIGILFIYLFAVVLGWLPSYGRGDVVTLPGGWTTGLLTISGLKAIILPALTLGLFTLTLIMRLIRAEMLEVLRTDYIKFARARGLTNRAVNFGHALKNTLVPVITVTGLLLGNLIAFAIITESVFQWPGMGRLFLQSIQQVDLPVMSAYLVMISFLFVVLNLVVDILYYVVDPRLRVEGHGGGH